MQKLTIGIHSRNDVVVILVHQRLDTRVRSVLGEELPREVLGRHGGDPLTRVDGTVNQDRRLGSFSARAPDVDTCEGAALHGCPGREDLGLTGESGLQVTQEGEMVRIGMVGREPCLAGDLDA